MKTITIIRSPKIVITTQRVEGINERQTRLLSLNNYYKLNGYSEAYIDAQLLSAGFSIKEIDSVNSLV